MICIGTISISQARPKRLTFYNNHNELFPNISLFRWFKSCNVQLASEGRIRKVAKLWRGDDYIVEDAPFLFPLKNYKGQYEVLATPWGYIDDLPNHTLSYLDALQK